MAAGISFSPLQNGQPGQTPQTAGSPLQDAIKILSFRLPTVVGASGVSPLVGNPGDSHLDTWLAKLFQGILPADPAGQPTSPFGPTGPQGPPTFTNGVPPMPGGPGGSAPPPVITTTPPDVPKAPPPGGTIDKLPGPSQGGDVPTIGPPDWRSWMTGSGMPFGR